MRNEDDSPLGRSRLAHGDLKIKRYGVWVWCETGRPEGRTGGGDKSEEDKLECGPAKHETLDEVGIGPGKGGPETQKRRNEQEWW